MTSATTSAAGGPVEAAGAAPAPEHPFRDTRFRVFAAGNFVNNIGEAVYALTLPLLAYDATGSYRVMALLATAVPLTFVLNPLLGVAVDRWGSRVLVVPGLLVQASAALTMNLLLRHGYIDTWLLFCLALLIAVGGLTYQIGWITGVPLTFPQYPLKARGALNSLFFATSAAGPAIVAIALNWTTYRTLLWLNFVTFLAPIVVWIMGIRPARPTHDDTGAKVGYLRGLIEGWRAVLGDRPLRSMVATRSILTLTLGTGVLPLVLFRLRHDWHFSSAQTSRAGLLYATALLVGSMVAGRHTARARQTLSLSTALFFVAAWLLAASVLPLFAAGVALVGLATGSMLRIAVVLPVQRLRQDVLGRGYALIGVVVGIASLCSPALTVLLTGAIGTSATFAALSAGAIAALLYLRRTPW